MEDTFVGGETSDISITLWFLIAGVMTFTTFIFFNFLKIKDLKSQKNYNDGYFVCLAIHMYNPVNIIQRIFLLSNIYFDTFNNKLRINKNT
jgi:hypothetical protein